MTGRRLKFVAILAGVALSTLVLLAWTREWFSVALTTEQTLSVGGDAAAPALTALALSGLALAGALTIAGVVFRVILGVLELAIGALVVTSAAVALADPVAASAASITTATAVSGVESIAALVSGLSVSAWPAVTLGLGILLCVLGVAIAVTARLWPESSRRYQAVRLEAVEPGESTIGDWDALSAGRDPTQGSGPR